MQRRILLFTLALGASLALMSSGVRARVSSPVQETKNSAPRVELKVETAKPEATTIREVDEAGLLKLLQRDGANARPLLVNFWATWCDPCREEFPDLVKIDAEYRARGLDFILVSLDDASEIKLEVPAFIEKMRAGSIPSFLLNAKDPEAAINGIDKNWRGELPATFLFNRQGKLAFNHKGRIKAGELRKAIDKVLSEK
ncbi:MAG TPA: TlpA disulfide reductase family protein [Pyrinomonadaceae bacterium]|jgi:thiol-disulfide isomerase/thioredoxin|nr:TlpA disulfide reductase family protein [Pyrinomonadaceae bacterium]